VEKSPIDYNRISKALQSTIELIEDENVQMDSEVLGGLLSAKEELTNALAFELFYSNPRNQS
jgi:hypothetical protein